MCQTLFEIPYEIGGVPVFGIGVLLGLWAVVSAVLLVQVARRHGFGAELLNYSSTLGLIAMAIIFVPKLFPGALPVRGYGVMLLVAIFSGLWLGTHRARQMGVDPERILSLAFWMFLAGIIGARLFHVIEYWQSDYLRDSPLETLKAVINIPAGGLVVYGALLGAGSAFVFYMRRQRLPMLAFADLIAPALVLGLALGRIGCLLNGCCYGGSCDLPWAVTFPPGSPPYESQLQQGALFGVRLDPSADGPPVVEHANPDLGLGWGGLEAGDRIAKINGQPIHSADQARQMLVNVARSRLGLVVQLSDGRTITRPARQLPQRSLPVHPTQIYATINALILCLFLLAYYPFRRRDGEVTLLLLTLYPMTRFLLEVIRTDEMAVFRTGMSISQNVSLLLLLCVGALAVYIFRQPRKLAFSADRP